MRLVCRTLSSEASNPYGKHRHDGSVVKKDILHHHPEILIQNKTCNHTFIYCNAGPDKKCSFHFNQPPVDCLLGLNVSLALEQQEGSFTG